MKKQNIAPFFILLIAFLFSACVADSEVPEGTVCSFNDPPTRDKMDNTFHEYGDVAAEILLGHRNMDEYPNFSVQNAEGQVLTLEGQKAQGNIRLLLIVGAGFPKT